MARMEDKYSHNSFTLLQTTELIREVVDHVLRQPDSEVPAELRKDLANWKDLEQERKEKTFHSHDSVEDVSSSISFDLVKRAHKQLAKTPLGTISSSLFINTQYNFNDHDFFNSTNCMNWLIGVSLHTMTCVLCVMVLSA